jgi:hypothetical protein
MIWAGLGKRRGNISGEEGKDLHLLLDLERHPASAFVEDGVLRQGEHRVDPLV